LAEFLAIHQSDASLLGCLLRRLAGRVSLGDSERAAGVGFFQSDDLLLRKRPLGGQAALPEKLAEGVESEATLICSGAVGSTARSFNEQMTLPFRFKRWLFATADDYDDALRLVSEEAARLLVDEWGFSMEDAFIFLSVACDAGVAQACKPAPCNGGAGNLPFAASRHRFPRS